MTIDEVIKQIEKIVEDNQRIVDTHRFSDVLTIEEAYCDDTEIIEERLAVHQKRADDFRQLAEWLKELKRLREQTRWIPVNERLPKPQEDGNSDRSRRLLVTIEVKRFSNGCVSKDTCVTEGYYRFSDKKWYTRIRNDVNVVAWQPLPEPYKEEKESEE